MNLSYLLTKRERGCISAFKKIYKKTFTGHAAQSDKNLFMYLGDNTSNRLTWSATSGRIPTLRMSGGRMWSEHAKRWMTGRDKLSSLGFPVTPEVSESMGVPELPVRDIKRASSIAGNAMHFASVTVVQLLALACFKKLN